ncbi:hypothetical protein ACHAP6_002081 [Verticillium nonalfalfae]
MAQKPQQFDVLGETRARIDRPRDSLALVFKRALELGLDDVSKDGGVRFTVGTMCSGTDAPILALRELQDAALAMGYNHLFDFDHQFSVEIEAYKQAFIERNSKPSGEIYRDVVQVSDPSRKDATTAHGSLAPIPAAPDLLVAGSSCVDFSKLNNKRDILAKHSVLSRLYEEAKNTRNGLDFGTVTPQSQSHDVRMALQDVRDSFHMEGESVKTFGSILQFIYDQRPKLIILENVSHAPWRAFTHFWLPLVGYVALSMKVDSKNFLVPQTRTRGYLVAVDQWHYGTEMSTRIARLWSSMMESSNWFPNQYPEVHKFLLSSMDQRILEARAIEERKIAENMARDVEARMCAYDHAKVRRQQGLGPDQPFTQRDGRGNLLPRDTSWQAYIRGTSSRVQDLLDITWLSERKKAGRDLNYKAKYLDLGVGVERLKTQIGIVGCVLPDGDLFATDQGRPILGIEALSLQGLPIDRIRTSVETQADLHDMAGNAMTTTVVGAATLCVLIAERRVTRSSGFHNGLPLLDNGASTRTQHLKHLFAIRQSDRNGVTDVAFALLQYCPSYSTAQKDQAAVTHLMTILQKGRRYCPCAGYRKHNPATGLMICTICNQVRCVTCAGNPAHAFEMLFTGPLWSWDETIHALRGILPNRFALTGGHGIPQDDKDVKRLCLSLHATEKEERNITSRLRELRKCLGAVYYLDHFDNSQVIVATYVSTCGRIELSIGSDQVVWYLYLPEPLEPGSFKQRAAPPIARATLDKSADNVFPNRLSWEVFFIQPLIVVLSMEPQSDSTFRCSVTEFNGQPIKSYPIIPMAATELMVGVEGLYEFSQNCGTPFDLLYSRRAADGEPSSAPCYLFLDTKHTTEPEEDSWVMSQSVSKLEPGTHREVLCKFPSSWKEQELKLRQFGTPQTVQCEIPGLWRSVHQTNGTLMNISMSDVHLAPDRMTAETSEDLHVIIPGALSFPDVAQAPIPVLQLRIDIPDLPFPVHLLPQLWKTDGEIFKECAKETGPGEKWMRVSDHHHKDALSLISFALGALKADHLPREFKVGLLERAGAACQILDADFPNPKIHLLWEGLKVKKLFDDSEAAQKLAESYRKRPLPLELDVQIVRADQPRHTGDLYSGRARGNIAQETELIVRILFNPTALAHRAWLHLPRDGLIRGIRRDVMQDGHIGFAVDVEFVDPSLKMIEPFEACLSQDVVPPATCDMAIQLPSFDSCGVQLRPDQIQSVQWMIEKESSNSCFVETEVEEFLVPSSSIRLRSHAEVVNRARGGVLAHDVGFGKTIVTLALIDHQRNQSDERSTIERHAWTQERHCHLKATLIVCPPQIVDQWRDEIERFLGSENWNVVVINAKTPFHRGMLETADLVILSTAFIHSSAFVQTLTRVAGAAKFHDASGASSREFNIWYREAVTDLEDSYQCYADNNKNNGALAKHISLRTQERKVSFEKARAACIVESRRKDQKVKATARTQRATKTRKKPRRTTTAASESDHSAESDSDSAMDDRKRKVATPHVVNDFKDATVLQMYSFDRVVLDEFSYENKSTAAFVANCVASSKWILSGTPPMADLSQVCAIADLVNIHVARPEASVPKSFPSITRGPRLDKTTRGEAMRQYADPKSAQFALERHEQARIFIEHKMTRRETDISHIRVTEQVIVCRLDPVSSVVYAQLQQVLYDARWDIEEVPGDMRAIIDWLLQQTGNNKASKARENLRMSWHNTIQSLLVQSSTNLSAYGENMKKLGMDVRAGAVSGITVLTSMRTIYQRLQARSKAMIKSQFDMLMYVVDQVQMSGLLAMTNAKGRDKTKQDKAIYYQDHLDDFIQRFTADRPWSFGDAEIRDDFWKGGNGVYGAIEWWKLTEEDVEAMDEDELKHVEANLVCFKASYNSETQIEATSQQLKESVCDLLKANVLDQYHEAEPEKVAANIGLASATLLDAYWKDTAKSKDFEFGNKFRPYRPQLNEEETDRGTSHDQATNRMAMALQSVQAGIEEYIRQARRLRVLGIVQSLFAFAQDLEAGHKPNAPTCSVCGSQDNTEIKDLSLFITCGHLLCSGCVTAHENQHHQVESTAGEVLCPVDSCSAMARSALVPCTQLISATAASTLDFEGKSAKVMKILDVIRTDVKDDEKALLFVGNKKLKAQLFDALAEDDNVDVYMTTGTHHDTDAIRYFKEPNENGKTKVLVQSLMSEESAGTNLTEANHIMFAAPLHTDRRNHYMYMRQARGRAIRFGQTRPVKVYHFVTAHTMEVDVLEHRLRHKLLIPEGGDRMPLDDLDYKLYALDTRAASRGPPSATKEASAATTVSPALRRIRPYIDEVETRKLLDSQEYDEWQDRLDVPPSEATKQAPWFRSQVVEQSAHEKVYDDDVEVGN